MSIRSTAHTVDEYIAEFPSGIRELLEQVREVIREAAPEASETISYAIPTFDLHGRHLVHFAGYDRHIGFYPGPSGIAAFKSELNGYRSAKGSVQFPVDRPLPAALIGRIVAYRVEEMGRRTSTARRHDQA